jgi:hypothetical protein
VYCQTICLAPAKKQLKSDCGVQKTACYEPDIYVPITETFNFHKTACHEPDIYVPITETFNFIKQRVMNLIYMCTNN